jgi:SAM-dependent methyltransferase
MSFEKEYYESPAFWSGSMIDDEANTTRINCTIELLPKQVQSILDVGCGNGKFVNKLKNTRHNLKITGTDRSEEALRYVNTDKFVSNITSITVPENYADCVSCLQVLEHLNNDDHKLALKELSRTAKKYIIISVPYAEDLQKSFTQCPKCLTSFSRELHLRSYTDEIIENLFINHNFKLQKKINIIKTKEFLGLQSYIIFKNKIFQKKKIFESPICILCGYKSDEFVQQKQIINDSLDTKHNSFKSIVKKLWPKRINKGYWIIALYEKISNDNNN